MRRQRLGESPVHELKDVFVLGSGFSAAAARLPTLREVSKHPTVTSALGRYELPAGIQEAGQRDIELVLTHLSSVPWGDRADRLQANTHFQVVSESIARAIEAEQRDKIAGDAPDWLTHLVRAWHLAQATVISFNYDTVVELAMPKAVGELPPGKRNPPSTHHNYRIPLTYLMSRTGAAIVGADKPAVPTFELLKLHGSIHWWWEEDQERQSGRPIFEEPLDAGWSGRPGLAADEREKLTAGLVQVIAPPTLDKSRYLGSPLLRSQWTLAQSRLTFARRVFVLGYSMPPTDLLAFQLLLSGLSRDDGLGGVPGRAELQVVDLDPDCVRRFERLLEAAPDLPIDIEAWPSGPAAISDFAHRYAADVEGNGS